MRLSVITGPLTERDDELVLRKHRTARVFLDNPMPPQGGHRGQLRILSFAEEEIVHIAIIAEVRRRCWATEDVEDSRPPILVAALESPPVYDLDMGDQSGVRLERSGNEVDTVTIKA